MDSTSLSTVNLQIWVNHLIECSKIAESCAIPFTDMFGVETFARCMRMKSGTITDWMNDAEIKSVKIKGVTEAVYHASDIAKVFGSI
jgi:hypothetical protein